MVMDRQPKTELEGPHGLGTSHWVEQGMGLDLDMGSEPDYPAKVKLESGLVTEGPEDAAVMGIKMSTMGELARFRVTGVAASLSVIDIAFKARRASEMGGTLRVALFVCTLPGQVIYYCLDPRKMEFGLRIHSFNVTPLMELLIAVERTVPKLLLEFVLAVVRVRTVSFMNSLDMENFSTSIMKAPHCLIGSADSLPPAKIHVPLPPSRPTKSKESLSQPLQLCEDDLILELANEESVYAVNSKRDSLNDWNSKAGDGDCSSTMYRGATTILDDIKKYYPLIDAAETMNENGSYIRKAMGRTQQNIYPTMLWIKDKIKA
ncbi:hypothetical protein V6N12_000166 [Hibiscus sabdariffa]|uniref:DhaL domain-containing protein n=1 Tax=Hibiscus sabdariffa TaxID=183260 RepID=A0ABR2B4K9_9ROSI